MDRHKPTNKKRNDGSPKPGGGKTSPRSFMRVLNDFIDAALTFFFGIYEELHARIKAVWDRAPQWLRKTLARVFAAVLLPTTLYCGWITFTRGPNIVVFHIGSISVYSGFAVSILLIVSAISLSLINANLPAPVPSQNAGSPKRKHLPGQSIALLPRARWRYLRGQYAQAQVMLDALLVREPGNAAAIELQNLIARRQRQANPQTAETHADAPSDRAEKLLDSKLPIIAARILVIIMLCLACWGCAEYIRVGLTQGWQTTAWSGISKNGQAIRQTALSAAVWLSLAGTICLTYLIVDLGGVLEPLKRGVTNFAARIRQRTVRLSFLRRR